MQINYKHYILSILLSIWTTIGWAQTPQLNITLTTNESGTTKNYVARESIVLGNGFKYTATLGQRFIARIDKTITITLADGTIIKPDGTIIQPDGTTIKPDGTIIQPNGTTIKPDGTTLKPDGTIVMPDGTIFKTDGTIIKPDGTIVPDISKIIPTVWFKTVPVTSDINGRYKWKDFSTNNVSLVKCSANGTSIEYTVIKDSVMNFNFNPGIDLSSEVSKEIKMSTSNLAQATIMGVWGSRKETPTTNQFIFALNGRQNESILFSKSNVYSSIESGKDTLAFGNDTVKNLLCKPSNNISDKKARESSLRIASYYKSNMPNTSIWGEDQKSVISLGSSFQNANTNNTSTFSSNLSNFAGFKGYTPELLVFEKVLSPVETTIFESYLAIKYGVSLEKSYLSGTGTVIWDYVSDSTYNNRITGYGREDMIGLDQKMATSSYQEAPYYSDSCDSYLDNNLNNLSSRNRLLVMGWQPDSPMKDGEYVLFGDNDNSVAATNSSMPGFKTMQRSWLVSTKSTSKNWIELSYFDSLATELAAHKYDAYLIIDRSGKADFKSTSETYLISSLDETRSKLIFNNIVWDADKNGKDAFTFGYKLPPGLVKRFEDDEDSKIDAIDYLRIYYPDPRNLTTVTVKIQNAKPTTSIILMYDMSGRRIYRKDLPESDEVQFADIKLPETGIYIIKVITNQREYSQKVISRK